MNLVSFPAKTMDLSILRRIIQGGLDKLLEARVVLVGGHSVEDKELKYGLSVTGFVHPRQVLTKKDLRLGDLLILTKPLGTGVINTAVKGGLASPAVIEEVTRLMAALNNKAAECMLRHPVHACTDITGFGLLGHLAEMVLDSGLGMVLQSGAIPIISEALQYAGMGMLPGGAHKNREFRECMVDFSGSLERTVQDVLFDPQTSGGLLISVSAESADSLLHDLRAAGVEEAAVIGEVVAEPQERIAVR
jgi:selenide,water dikinase